MNDVDTSLSTLYAGSLSASRGYINDNLFYSHLGLHQYFNIWTNHFDHKSLPVLALVEVESPVDCCEESKGDRKKKPDIWS